MTDMRPGLDPRRLNRLMGAAIDRCSLDLSGLTVLTEAASGAYVVTPVIAAMAGADVYALVGGNAYASSAEIQELTLGLARFARVADRIQLVHRKDPMIVRVADIITNSGQLRPIDADMIAFMKPSSVIPLMYESWEYRHSDVDLRACRGRNIMVAGTNERHPSVDVFSFLGQMAVMQLHEAGIAVRHSHLLLLCDNDFGPFIMRDLENAGADVRQVRQLTAEALSADCDAVILAMHPRAEPALTALEAGLLSRRVPGAVLVQYWGDTDRASLEAAGVPVWPREAPRAGHMGILPSALGPEPIVRLQSGGLKVGQILAGGLDRASSEDLALVQVLLTLCISYQVTRSYLSLDNVMYRILLLGMGPTALSALESLTARFELVGLMRDARPQSAETDRVLELAHALQVPVFPDVSIEGVEQAVVQTSPDCVVVSSYDRILPSRVLRHCRFVNVHYAPLPEYRGRANVNWAIINGELETAITVHVIAPGLDAGNILCQHRVPIGADDTVADLYAKLNEIQRKVLPDTVGNYISGYEGVPQDESAATYGCTRVPGDGEINWSVTTQQIYALVRALAPPYPGAHTYLEERRISILRASPLLDAPRYVGRVPGRVVNRSRQNGYVDVLTGDGVLRIYEVRTSDSGAAPASAVIASMRQTLGLRTVDLLARIEKLESRLNRLGSADLGPNT